MPMVVTVPCAVLHHGDTGSETGCNNKRQDCCFNGLHIFWMFEHLPELKFKAAGVFRNF